LEAVEIIGRLGGHRVLSNPKPAVYNPQLLWIYLVGRLADGNGKSRSSDKTLAASCGEETVMQTELQLRAVDPEHLLSASLQNPCDLRGSCKLGDDA
jgi:hypothetical protein